ncbi:MAG: DUF6489 family protein [Kiloniellaceae bacterium]
MKITIDVDCTPDEARRFLGLPDVAHMQDAMMAEVQKRMMANLEAMDPETMVKTWLPAGLQELEKFQKMFWTQVGRTAAEGRARPSGGKKDDPAS